MCPADNSLLEDLLEASASLYHRHVATIQRVFVEQYLQTLRDRIAQNPRFRAERLEAYRQALREKQEEMILEQSELRRERDAKIHAYVAALEQPREAAA
jgi:hypothetical protein